MRRLSAAASAIVWLSSAHAETRITIGRPPSATLSRVAVTLWAHGGRVTGSLAIEATGRAKTEWGEVVIPIALPEGAVATSLAITANKVTTRAALVAADQAHRDYRAIVERKDDPGLLEWTPRGVVLRMFPVAFGKAIRGDITFEFADRDPTRGVVIGSDALIRELAVTTRDDSAADRVTTARNTRELAIALPAMLPALAGEPLAVNSPEPVTAERSLLAGWGETARLMPTVTFHCCAAPRYKRSLDKQMIRRVIAQQKNRLAYCYERELQRDHSLAGDAIIRFVIEPSGEVSAAEVDGSLADPAVRQCLVETARGMTFPASDETTQVNYPLFFQLAR